MRLLSLTTIFVLAPWCQRHAKRQPHIECQPVNERGQTMVPRQRARDHNRSQHACSCNISIKFLQKSDERVVLHVAAYESTLLKPQLIFPTYARSRWRAAGDLASEVGHNPVFAYECVNAFCIDDEARGLEAEFVEARLQDGVGFEIDGTRHGEE